MKNINHKEISMNDYKEIESRIDSMTREEELIEIHKKLIDKSCKCDCWEIKDCGVEFIRKFLSRDWGRSIVYHYSQGAEKFIKSEYLSNYFKRKLKNMFMEIDEIAGVVLLCTPIMTKILDSSKTINEMDEKEIKYILFQLKAYMADNNKYKSLIQRDEATAHCFEQLLFKLDGKGVVACLKDNNYVTKRQLADQILLTSGLNNRASYYSGRGVNYGDLNDENLVSIFIKLLKIDVDYATNFVNMVRQMKTLGATEFINSFMNFAVNDFKSETLNIEDNNVSLDGIYGEARDAIAFISIFSAMSRGNDQDYQIRASEQMKNSFMSRIRLVLQSINLDHDELDGQSFNSGYQIKKS